MQPRIAALINELKQAKQQGLTFESAKESVFQKGYTDKELTRATYSFTYSDLDISDTGKVSASVSTPNITDKQMELMGNSILQDKERSARTYVYLTVIPVAGCAFQIYRFILNRKFWASHDDKYLLYHHNTEIIIIVLTAAVVWIGIIKLTFMLKDPFI